MVILKLIMLSYRRSDTHLSLIKNWQNMWKWWLVQLPPAQPPTNRINKKIPKLVNNRSLSVWTQKKKIATHSKLKKIKLPAVTKNLLKTLRHHRHQPLVSRVLFRKWTKKIQNHQHIQTTRSSKMRKLNLKPKRNNNPRSTRINLVPRPSCKCTKLMHNSYSDNKNLKIVNSRLKRSTV